MGGVASAQEGTVVIGGSGAPDVQVDLGAVDGGPGYGYGPSGRRLLMPNAKLPPSGPIILHPPRAHPSVALKPPSAKAKKQAATPAATEPAMSEQAAPPAAPTPPPPPKMAELPPPPPAKKVMPVEGEKLPGPETGAKAETAAPPVPPPEPPPPAAAKTAAAKNGKEKAAVAAGQPPATNGKGGNGSSAVEAAPPPPPPLPSPGAKTPSESAAAPPPPPPPPGGSTAPPPSETKAAAPPEVAALPPPGQPVASEKPKSIAFAVGAATLADPAKQDLSGIAQALNANPDLRLQIVAYASGADDNASQARRLSLSRALAVRSYLIDAGVRSTRMDVRALGNKFDTGPGDRVDLIIVKP